MLTSAPRAYQDLVEHLITTARDTLSSEQFDSIEQFLGQYYHRVPVDDLTQASPQDLFGAVLAHFEFARNRTPGAPLVRAYNPGYEKHGWDSTHSAIEIVTDDMPFLVDSVSMTLNRRGLTTHLVIHPVVWVQRNPDGVLLTTSDEELSARSMRAESFMQFQIDRQLSLEVLRELEADILQVIGDVSQSYQDWESMQERFTKAAINLESSDQEFLPADITESAAFCRWLVDGNFTFLGYLELIPTNGSDDSPLKPVESSGLGILQPSPDSLERNVLDLLPPVDTSHLKKSNLLVVTKASQRSTVHRPAYMDLIVIRRFAESGQICGECCLLGLFSTAAYSHAVRDIPLLKRKMQLLLERSHLPVKGHGAKVLQNIVETYPRDDLFQVSDDELFEIAMGILDLQERHRIRVFPRRDCFRRFYSCLVYVPRDRFNSELRIRIGKILNQAYHGRSFEFNVNFSESVLARIHFLINTDPNTEPKDTTREIEQRIELAARSWIDDLRNSIVNRYGEDQGMLRFKQYRDAFPLAYQEDCSPRRASFDIDRLIEIAENGGLGIQFYRPRGVASEYAQLKLLSPKTPIPLSDVLPVIENMGLRVISERPYCVRPDNVDPIWIHIFTLTNPTERKIDVDGVRDNFERAFLKIWSTHVENDGFNQLVLAADLHWREIITLRAYYRFLRQVFLRYSQEYVVTTLVSNPRMAARLVRLFHARFDPDGEASRPERLDAIRKEIAEGIERVTNLDEDRILSAFVNVIESTLRTNFYQRDDSGKTHEYLSLKLESSAILHMPDPQPLYEIFVYSPRMEAVHLRGGKVARGGLRWSDRPEDFRTEVLDLMKAQMVKNALIVPVGSKGGFVVGKLVDGDHEPNASDVVDCYRTFIRGMLDITDNLKAGNIVPPPRVIRYDDDDPYLVVAADKGTASFSDIANEVAVEYDFWLGDAFASGSSSGYDHKGMGITARGAWESVKLHFRELGLNIQEDPFTVMGIGDMSGDVFGNGMLLSPTIRLQAAFNHRHIFIDPDPDSKKSFAERKRLFGLPKSSWGDYDCSIISPGGGVWSRSTKSIELSAEIQRIIGVQIESLTPNELIHHLLKAPVDLLWNGGVGTYVKASTEAHEEARNRANDTLRVNANDLRCRVVGEGGNLGMTQLARVEFNRNGGRCYSDAIDNSAGVNTSDHEVNIKILLDTVINEGDLTTKQRNQLLSEMTDDVAKLVLEDNYGQSNAISVATYRAPQLIHQHERLIRQLEKYNGLERKMENLPDDETLASRISNGGGLFRPELAVLMAYNKMTMFQALLDSDVPEDPFLFSELERYFPAILSKRFTKQLSQHRLRREIIATHVTNRLSHRVDPSFTLKLSEMTGCGYPEVTRAYAAAHEIYAMDLIWSAVESLDNQVQTKVQQQILIDAGQLIESGTIWLLCNRPIPLNINATVELFREPTTILWNSFPRVLAASNRLTQKRRVRNFLNAKVPADLANRAAGLVAMSASLDIVDVAQDIKEDVSAVATVYFELGDRLGLHWLRDRIGDLDVPSHWHSKAKFSLRHHLYRHQRDLVATVLASTEGKSKARVRQWILDNHTKCDRLRHIVTDLRSTGTRDFAMLSVAVSEAGSMLAGNIL